MDVDPVPVGDIFRVHIQHLHRPALNLRPIKLKIAEIFDLALGKVLELAPRRISQTENVITAFLTRLTFFNGLDKYRYVQTGGPARHHKVRRPLVRLCLDACNIKVVSQYSHRPRSLDGRELYTVDKRRLG